MNTYFLYFNYSLFYDGEASLTANAIISFDKLPQLYEIKEILAVGLKEKYRHTTAFDRLQITVKDILQMNKLN